MRRFAVVISMALVFVGAIQARSAVAPAVSYQCQSGVVCAVGTDIYVTGSGFDAKRKLRYTISGPVAPLGFTLVGQPHGDGTILFSIDHTFVPVAGTYTITFDEIQGSHSSTVASFQVTLS